MEHFRCNLVLAWLWIILGFVSGFLLGTKFHGENWLGGYASHKRRLYRLGHISFFGLALMNLMFYFTARGFHPRSPVVNFASWAFIVGAITMPLCCLVMAHFPKARLIFSVPVISLITAAALTLAAVIRAGEPATPALSTLNTQPSTPNSP